MDYKQGIFRKNAGSRHFSELEKSLLEGTVLSSFKKGLNCFISISWNGWIRCCRFNELENSLLKETRRINMEFEKIKNDEKNFKEGLDYFNPFSWRREVWDIMEELKKVEKMSDSKLDKLVMEEINKLKIEVMKNIVKNLDCRIYFSWVKGFEEERRVLNELKQMLDLKLDKRMMEEIKNLVMEVMKRLYCFNRRREVWNIIQKLKKMKKVKKKVKKILDLKWDKLMMGKIKKSRMEIMKNLEVEAARNGMMEDQCEMEERKQEWSGEKRFSSSSKHSVHLQLGFWYPQTLPTKDLIFYILVCGFFETFLSHDINFQQDCRFPIKNREATQLQLAIGYKKRSDVIEAKKRKLRGNFSQEWSTIPKTPFQISMIHYKGE
ncbi:uncharacterized protein LOC114541019 isoform X2 [Dendronephthya gigantea]|uniref:uncharacterized protein LOC114541019 isoform X2 n=1 Tax=Dendronephthya gigantea TaxID=151771 RepID=UPI00106A65D2|nr:uncharacterized protein LOC114541019 isoform X2 [Dendronephthya gigantea]